MEKNFSVKNLTSLNEFAKEVHSNSISKGWWEEERSFGEIIALCHSELSEALEEYRNSNDRIKKLPIYYSGGGYVATEPTACCKKPEGIAVELADCVIRILDYCGKENIDIEEVIAEPLISIETYETFGEFISVCHLYLSKTIECKSNRKYYWLAGLIKEIYGYCQSENINLDAAIGIKHEYNKIRPYRHGGKVI